MKRLFQNVIWPAIAGSVAWAFFTVLVDARWSDYVFWAKLLALLAVAVYLAVDWYRTDLVCKTINSFYWIADAFLAPLIALFAAATFAQSVWAPYAIALAFVAAIVGHLFGAWDESRPPASAWDQRIKLAAINALGLVVLGIGSRLARPYRDFSAPVAIALVVTIFLVNARKRRPSTPSDPRHRVVGSDNMPNLLHPDT